MSAPLPPPAGNGGEPAFRRHKFLSYQGYALPWYVTLLWLSFFIGGTLYIVRWILLE